MRHKFVLIALIKLICCNIIEAVPGRMLGTQRLTLSGFVGLCGLNFMMEKLKMTVDVWCEVDRESLFFGRKLLRSFRVYVDKKHFLFVRNQQHSERANSMKSLVYIQQATKI